MYTYTDITKNEKQKEKHKKKGKKKAQEDRFAKKNTVSTHNNDQTLLWYQFWNREKNELAGVYDFIQSFPDKDNHRSTVCMYVVL